MYFYVLKKIKSIYVFIRAEITNLVKHFICKRYFLYLRNTNRTKSVEDDYIETLLNMPYNHLEAKDQLK